MAAAQQLSPTEAQSATHCSQCGTGLVGEPLFTFRSQGRATTWPVGQHPSPTHAHCTKCADRYRSRINRRIERKLQRDRVKATRTNQQPDDCTMVAMALSTGIGYDRIVIRASRKDVGYTPGSGGLNALQARTMLAWCSENLPASKRMTTLTSPLQPSDGGFGPWNSRETVNQFLARCDRHASYYVAAFRLDSRGRPVVGHAMAIVNGKLENGFGGWGSCPLHTVVRVDKVVA